MTDQTPVTPTVREEIIQLGMRAGRRSVWILMITDLRDGR
jgi:hypothetical protein